MTGPNWEAADELRRLAERMEQDPAAFAHLSTGALAEVMVAAIRRGNDRDAERWEAEPAAEPADG